ncbi:MAG TPA: phytanoyl-CoA dioxygenase family protein [Rhizomicrobium sp.]|nr:phytanoyl-CoA dioxygenase family protein [Rhizomicrobium sp.]
MNIFNESFLAVDTGEIANVIRTDGFFYLEKALSDEWIEKLLADEAANRFAVNKNWVSGVYAENQYYLTHMLACSRAFFDYAIDPHVFGVCDRILGDKYRLKAMRYYETYGRHHMQWHTDNKTDRGFAHIPGLIFIVYLADVTDGEFQYIRGSQNWSGEKAYSDYTDAFIHENHGKDVVSFKAPKGTLLIYDTYGIHRAKPVNKSGFVRKSLFMQVDSKLDSAEPLLLNPSFFHGAGQPGEKLLMYFGFGRDAEYDVFPVTSLQTLQFKRLSLGQLGRWSCHRALRSLYNAAPQTGKNWVRRLMNKPMV